METESFDVADVPSVAEYKAAFLACRSALKSTAGQSLPLEMLKAHYLAPDQTLTPGELAAKMSLASASAANLQYGNFAKALCQHFGRKLKFPLAILVKFTGGKPGEELVKWTLISEAARALEELGWVKAPSQEPA